ncbi:hypothetical protein BDZ91DRAFT_851487 [Kalaharituber pfeilii]|nr:hypothetical protein BDZ91DRAFT_851487 [Kalaharituber pfeilii]
MEVAVTKEGLEVDGAGSRWSLVAGESEGSRWVGAKATVWDCEVAGMRGALEAVDSRAKGLLLQSLKQLSVQSREQEKLARVVELMAERQRRLRNAGAVKFAWVKAHVGIEGNEKADRRAKEGGKCMSTAAHRESLQQNCLLTSDNLSEVPESKIGRLSRKRNACLLASQAAASKAKRRAVIYGVEVNTVEPVTAEMHVDISGPLVYTESEESLVDESEWESEEEQEEHEQDIQDLSMAVDVYNELMKNTMNVDFSTITVSSNISVEFRCLARQYGGIKKLNKIYETQLPDVDR